MPYASETVARETMSNTVGRTIDTLSNLENRFHGVLNEPVAEKNGNRPPLAGLSDGVEQVCALAERISELFNRLEGKLGGPL